MVIEYLQLIISDFAWFTPALFRNAGNAAKQLKTLKIVDHSSEKEAARAGSSIQRGFISLFLYKISYRYYI